MGILRFLLAAAVIVGHSSSFFGLPLLDAGTAVKSFFVISGFYMALILDQKYPQKQGGLRLFYTNRFLRIFPLYYAVLLFSLLFYAAAAVAMKHPVDRLAYWVQAAHLGLWPILGLIVLTQFSVVGLDVTPLFSFSGEKGFALRGESEPADAVPAWRLNFLPHAWSIGAELVFYAVAPFLVKLSWRLLLALVFLHCAVSAILSVYFPGVLTGVFLYHFSLMQMGFFALGILAYRVYRSGVASVPSLHMAGRGVVAAVFVLGCLAGAWHSFLCGYGYVLLIFAALPFLFEMTKNSKTDRFIAELSYPMYLSHIPMKWVLLGCMGVQVKDEVVVSGSLLLCVTVAFSLLLVYVIDRPLERFRQQRFQKAATAT